MLYEMVKLLGEKTASAKSLWLKDLKEDQESQSAESTGVWLWLQVRLWRTQLAILLSRESDNSYFWKDRFEENGLKGSSPYVLITTITNVIIIIAADMGLPYCRYLGFMAFGFHSNAIKEVSLFPSFARKEFTRLNDLM